MERPFCVTPRWRHIGPVRGVHTEIHGPTRVFVRPSQMLWFPNLKFHSLITVYHCVISRNWLSTIHRILITVAESCDILDTAAYHGTLASRGRATGIWRQLTLQPYQDSILRFSYIWRVLNAIGARGLGRLHWVLRQRLSYMYCH